VKGYIRETGRLRERSQRALGGEGRGEKRTRNSIKGSKEQEFFDDRAAGEGAPNGLGQSEKAKDLINENRRATSAGRKST